MAIFVVEVMFPSLAKQEWVLVPLIVVNFDTGKFTVNLIILTSE
jgi:hypothetical protein